MAQQQNTFGDTAYNILRGAFSPIDVIGEEFGPLPKPGSESLEGGGRWLSKMGKPGTGPSPGGLASQFGRGLKRMAGATPGDEEPDYEAIMADDRARAEREKLLYWTDQPTEWPEYRDVIQQWRDGGENEDPQRFAGPSHPPVAGAGVGAAAGFPNPNRGVFDAVSPGNVEFGGRARPGYEMEEPDYDAIMAEERAKPLADRSYMARSMEKNVTGAGVGAGLGTSYVPREMHYVTGAGAGASKGVSGPITQDDLEAAWKLYEEEEEVAPYRHSQKPRLPGRRPRGAHRTGSGFGRRSKREGRTYTY